MAKGNVMRDEWSACALTAHVVVRSWQNFEKLCLKLTLRIFNGVD
jgi:hypothetical protein